MTIKRTAEGRSRVFHRPQAKIRTLPAEYTEEVETFLGSRDMFGNVFRWVPETLTVRDPETIVFKRVTRITDASGDRFEVHEDVLTGIQIKEDLKKRRMMMVGLADGKREKIEVTWEPTLLNQARK